MNWLDEADRLGDIESSPVLYNICFANASNSSIEFMSSIFSIFFTSIAKYFAVIGILQIYTFFLFVLLKCRERNENSLTLVTHNYFKHLLSSCHSHRICLLCLTYYDIYYYCKMIFKTMIVLKHSLPDHLSVWHTHVLRNTIEKWEQQKGRKFKSF